MTNETLRALYRARRRGHLCYVYDRPAGLERDYHRGGHWQLLRWTSHDWRWRLRRRFQPKETRR